MSVSDKGKSPDSLPPAGKHKRRFLSAEKKYQIFLEAQRAEAPVGELLRREGLCPILASLLFNPIFFLF